MLENATKLRIREDKILRSLVEGTVSETGADFFRALARNLSEALQTCGAIIAEYRDDSRCLRAVAFWVNNRFLDDYEYPIDGTPCQVVVDTKSRAHFPERLLEFFPNDSDLASLGAVSYLGAPLLDADGTLLGHLAVLDNRAMPAEPQLYELLDLFAARAVAELRRLRAEAATREREAQLSLLLDTAMDAILVLDRDLKITRLNPRATELFACSKRTWLARASSIFSARAPQPNSPGLRRNFKRAHASVLSGCRKGWKQSFGQEAGSRRSSHLALSLPWRALLHGILAQYERAIGSGAAYPLPHRGGGVLACCCRGSSGGVGDHRPQRRNSSRVRCDPPGRSDRRDRSHPRRNRHGKGTRRSSHP